ncbi:HN1_G0054360.mRNA.1.CDS.1 [Saccharomyces cerevisiae]|nr:HN1_G0054360.mRNA.1.CDS.1 [Saccharomyces cerevisiae]CAI4486873.1 BAL_1a_G0022540.mRNA.1.CDS.1 [Saccharomyces cerevisiae]CAI7139599.1 BAL_1a_G0022540.mRNA.1.CDS.1 [Saccharomyces cerevisiae]
MEMTLFLNESYIFHRLRMWSTVFWGLCLFVCAECDSANNRGARVPYKTLFRAFEVSVFGQKEYPNFRFGPSYRSLCLSPYSICCKRPPMEEVILYYPSPDSLIKNRKRVLEVAYL